MRLEIDEQERIMSKHRHDFFNLNTRDYAFRGIGFSVLVCCYDKLKYLLLRDYSLHSMVVVCALAIIATTSLYFFLALFMRLEQLQERKPVAKCYGRE